MNESWDKILKADNESFSFSQRSHVDWLVLNKKKEAVTLFYKEND